LAELEGINALRVIKVHGCYRPPGEQSDGFVDTAFFHDGLHDDMKHNVGFGYQDVTANVEGPEGTVRALETSPGRWDVYYKGRRVLQGSPAPLADAKRELQREHINTGEVRLIIQREAKKPGRKPIGEVAMSGAQRKAKYDAKKKLQLPATQRALPPGAAAPPPLGPAVPGPNLVIERNNMHLEKMIAQHEARLDQHDAMFARLDEILTNLLKDPDHPLTREEFWILAAAAARGSQLH